MADTKRSVAELLVLFANNSTGLISEQDLRDLVVSATPAHGSIYVSSSAATTVTNAGTYYKAAGTTALTGMETDFDMPANNRLRYTGASPRHMHIASTICCTCSTNNQVLGFRIYHYDNSGASGATIASSQTRQKIGTGADLQSVSLHADVMLDTNDYLELHITNETSAGTTVTVDNLYLFAIGMLE